MMSAANSALRYFLLVCMLSVPVLSIAREYPLEANKPDAPSNVLDGKKLLGALRAGGYVIYFRHGLTDTSTTDVDPDRLDSCATQRVLSEEGRSQMRDIGVAIKALGIHVSGVRSSPYCRSMDTATLAFGKTEPDDNLGSTVTADEETALRKTLALKKLLSTPPAVGSNSVLAGHSGNLQEATGIWPKPEGVAIVFKPETGGKFSYVARIAPEQWLQWARKGRAP